MREVIKTGILGFGKQGSHYARRFLEGNLCPELRFSAIAETDREKRDWAKDHLPPDVKIFDSERSMLDSGSIDACIIATPHILHPEHAISCFGKGIHVMCEKPAGIHILQVEEMNREADRHPDLVFGIMLNQRTNCVYRKLRQVILDGEYGKIRRIHWTVNNWYRGQLYFDSFDWRGIWNGSFGGTIMDQCTHQLDLWQWLFGMPDRVTCRMGFGRHHDIEVEDEVSAIFEYDDGVMGTFEASTSIPNGKNMLEVNLDGANITTDGSSLNVEVFEQQEQEWRLRQHELFKKPGLRFKGELETDGENLQHKGVLDAWADAILGRGSLIADGREGIHAVMIADAMYLSAFTVKTVEMPVDGALYYRELMEKAAGSKPKGPVKDRLAAVRESFAVMNPKVLNAYFGTGKSVDRL